MLIRPLLVNLVTYVELGDTSISTIFRGNSIKEICVRYYRVVTCAIKMASEVDSVDEEDSEARPSEREVTVSSPLLVSKTKTKAFLWKYFGFETDTNGRPRCVNSPKCRLCNATVEGFQHIQVVQPFEK